MSSRGPRGPRCMAWGEREDDDDEDEELQPARGRGRGGRGRGRRGRGARQREDRASPSRGGRGGAHESPRGGRRESAAGGAGAGPPAHLRLPAADTPTEPPKSWKPEDSVKQPLVCFSQDEQVKLENFYTGEEYLTHKTGPPKKSSKLIQQELARKGYRALCAELDGLYGTDPDKVWEKDNHGRKEGLKQLTKKGKDGLTAKEDRALKANQRRLKALKIKPSKKVALELELEKAKRNIQQANYKVDPRFKVTKRMIHDHLVKNDLDGLEYATPAQLKRAKLELMLKGQTGNMDERFDWIYDLFERKDRDGSNALSFPEFKAMMRKHGKVKTHGPDGVSDDHLFAIFQLVDVSQDGEIQPEEFEEFMRGSVKSKECQEYERARAHAGEDRTLRVTLLSEAQIDSMFKQWDFNKSGNLSLAEVHKKIKTAPPPGWIGFDTRDALSKALIEAFNYADSDWSGEIQRGEEFEKLLKCIIYFNMILDMFNELDDTGDGRMSIDEFCDPNGGAAHICARIGDQETASMSESQLRAEFEHIDEDGGGYVMFKEFVWWMVDGPLGGPEQYTMAELVEVFQNRNGTVDLKAMRMEPLSKKDLEQFYPKVQEFTLDTLKTAFTNEHEVQVRADHGWVGFTSNEAFGLALKAADPDHDGGVPRQALGQLLKYVVYFHVLENRFKHCPNIEMALWMAQTQMKGVSWTELDEWFRLHQSGGRTKRVATKGKARSPRAEKRSGSAARSESRDRRSAQRRPSSTERGGRTASPRAASAERGGGRAASPSPRAPALRPSRGSSTAVSSAKKDRQPLKTDRSGGTRSSQIAALEEKLSNRLADPFVDEEWSETWSNNTLMSRDKEGEEMVLQLATRIRADGGLFEDRFFGADDSALYSDPAKAGANAKKKRSFRKDQDAFLAGIEGVQWKRPADMYGGVSEDEPPAAFVGDIDPDDVAQGNLGNCYFLAAIAAIATQGRDDSELEDILIKDLIVEDGADVGLFGVKFYINGHWRTVVIDDRLPCVQNQSGEWTPIFAQRPGDRQQFELWPMVFEKAWAKLHGSYETTAGGWTGDALNYLTGGVCRSIDFHSETAEETDCRDEWQELVDLTDDQGDFPLFLSSTLNNDAQKEEMEVTGLITGHAYSVMEAVEVRGQKVVCLRNPWGQFEWRGAFSDSSPEFQRIRNDLLKLVSRDLVDGEDDGSFWMSFDDFRTHFWEVEVCDPWELGVLTNSSPESMDVEIDAVRGEWVQGENAGGLKDSRTFNCNPTFDVVCDGKELSLALYQLDTRKPGGLYATPGAASGRRSTKKPPPTNFQKMTMYLVGPRGDTEQVVVLEAHQRQAANRVEVIPGKTYKVIVATWAPGVEGKFWVTGCGDNVRLTQSEPVIPTARERKIMTNKHLLGQQELCCVVSYKPITGQYYDNPEGPVLPDYADEYAAMVGA